jgi:hypothetical protein
LLCAILLDGVTPVHDWEERTAEAMKLMEKVKLIHDMRAAEFPGSKTVKTALARMSEHEVEYQVRRLMLFLSGYKLEAPDQALSEQDRDWKDLEKAQEAIEHARPLPKEHRRFLLDRSLDFSDDVRRRRNERRIAEFGREAAAVLEMIEEFVDRIEGAEEHPSVELMRSWFADLIRNVGNVLGRTTDEDGQSTSTPRLKSR